MPTPCTTAVRLLKRETGLDLDGILSRWERMKDEWAGMICGSTTCTGPSGGLCEAEPSSSNPAKTILVAGTKTYCTALEVAGDIVSSVSSSLSSCFPEDAEVLLATL